MANAGLAILYESPPPAVKWFTASSFAQQNLEHRQEAAFKFGAGRAPYRKQQIHRRRRTNVNIEGDVSSGVSTQMQQLLRDCGRRMRPSEKLSIGVQTDRLANGLVYGVNTPRLLPVDANDMQAAFRASNEPPSTFPIGDVYNGVLDLNKEAIGNASYTLHRQALRMIDTLGHQHQKIKHDVSISADTLQNLAMVPAATMHLLRDHPFVAALLRETYERMRPSAAQPDAHIRFILHASDDVARGRRNHDRNPLHSADWTSDERIRKRYHLDSDIQKFIDNHDGLPNYKFAYLINTDSMSADQVTDCIFYCLNRAFECLFGISFHPVDDNGATTPLLRVESTLSTMHLLESRRGHLSNCCYKLQVAADHFRQLIIQYENQYQSLCRYSDLERANVECNALLDQYLLAEQAVQSIYRLDRAEHFPNGFLPEMPKRHCYSTTTNSSSRNDLAGRPFDLRNKLGNHYLQKSSNGENDHRRQLAQHQHERQLRHQQQQQQKDKLQQEKEQMKQQNYQQDIDLMSISSSSSSSTPSSSALPFEMASSSARLKETRSCRKRVTARMSSGGVPPPRKTQRYTFAEQRLLNEDEF